MICNKCGEEKELDLFGNCYSSGKTYKRKTCKKCLSKSKNISYHKNKKIRRLDLITSRYNLDRYVYEDMLIAQNNKCAICDNSETTKDHWNENKIRNLAVDHDHSTGKVRGLLCNACNRALGYFKDNIVVIKQAIAYLERNK